MVFQSNVRSTQYKKGGRLIGNTGVGNCVIETTNVDGVYLKNIAILRGTTTDASDIGILQARGTQGTSYWAGDQYHENVFIDMGSNKDSNNSFGTIGFVNLAAEETRWHNIQIWANLPLIITWTDSCTRTKGDFSGLDTLTFSSDVGIQLAQNASNTVFRISGLGRLISYDYFSPCVLINSAATVDLGHCFMQKRISTTGAQTGDYVYAVENWNVSQFMHFGGVEGCEGYLLNRRDFTEADLNIRLAPVETSLPVIYLFDDGGNYQLRNVQMRVSSLYQDRPLIACKRFDGNNNEAMPFTLKNCEFKTDLPLNMTTLSDKRILRQTTYSTFHFKNQSLKVSDHCLTTDIRMNVGQNGQSVEIARIHMPTYITNLGAFTASIQLSGTLSNAIGGGIGSPSCNSFSSNFNVANRHNSQTISCSPVATTIGTPAVCNASANQIDNLLLSTNINQTSNWIELYAEPETSGVNNASVLLQAQLKIRWEGAHRDCILVEKFQ